MLSIVTVDLKATAVIVAELRRCIRSAPHIKSLRLPIFVLDEALPESTNVEGMTTAYKRLRLARNLLCSVGLVVIVMGTNSNAAEHIKISKHSSSCENPRLFCKLITNLPKATEGTLCVLGATEILNQLYQLDNLKPFAQFGTYLFTKCNPLFVNLFVEVWNRYKITKTETVDILNFLLREMSNLLFARKKLWLIGQLCMYFAAHVRTEHAEEMGTKFS